MKKVKKKTRTEKTAKKDDILLRHATVKDAQQIQDLIMHYAKKDMILPRSLNELYENVRDFVVLEKKGTIIACGALHVCWEDLSEVKSLAVSPRYKRKGYGSRIVKYLLKESETLGVRKVFTLTYQVEFFKAMGFRIVSMETLPKKIWAECIKCVRFSSCNETALIINL